MDINAMEINGISKSFKGFSLEDVTIKLKKGTIMGVVGANGAGKTTIMKCIMNMYAVDCGNIEVCGYDHVEDEIMVKNVIGYVPAEPYFTDDMNIQALAKSFSKIYEQWNEEIYSEYIKKWDIPVTKKFKEYSKGMKTKAMLMLAISHNPQVLLLDEPTAGLDPAVRREVLDMLRQFVENEENVVMFSTHITTDLDKVADYITVIDRGRVVESEMTDAIEDKYIVVSGNGAVSPAIKENAVGIIEENGRYEALMMNQGQEYPGSMIRRPLAEDLMVFFSAGRMEEQK